MGVYAPPCFGIQSAPGGVILRIAQLKRTFPWQVPPLQLHALRLRYGGAGIHHADMHAGAWPPLASVSTQNEATLATRCGVMALAFGLGSLQEGRRVIWGTFRAGKVRALLRPILCEAELMVDQVRLILARAAFFLRGLEVITNATHI